MAKLYHLLLILIALCSIGQFIHLVGEPYLFLTLSPGLFLIYHLRTVMRTTTPKDFDPELKKVALSTFAISIFLFVGLMIAKHYGA